MREERDTGIAGRSAAGGVPGRRPGPADARTIQKEDHPKGWPSFLEQDTGVEPAFTAWEAVVLPIYESCVVGVL